MLWFAAPRRIRLALGITVLGLVGWFLPANQSAISNFELPTAQIQEFEVVSTPQPWGTKQRYWITLTQADGHLGYLLADRDLGLQLGASYRGPLDLRNIETLERAGYSAQLVGEHQLISRPDDWQQLIGDSRSAFLERVTGWSSDSRGLVLGLAIGDRSQISDDLIFAMRELSLSHIVAVSGANLAIAMGAAFALARALGAGRRTRFLAASLTALGYAAVVGPEPSVLRALFMAHVVLLCLLLGRRAAAMVAISWAAIILLAVDPFLATDFGFALSVAATSGILTLTKPIQQRLEALLQRALALALAVSVAAQLFTLPILLLLQPGIPSYSVIANLLAMPLLAPITLLGLLAFILQPLPMATEYLTGLASLPARLIESLANVLVELPLTRLPWPDQPIGVIFATAIVLACAVGLRSRSGQRKLSWLAALISIAGLGIGITDNLRQAFPSNWLVIACDVGQGDALLVRSEGSVALIDVGPEPEPVANCLRRAGVNSIDLLVLTHFDRDHVGGIHGVIDCCQLRSVMLPDFADSREIVTDVVGKISKESGVQLLSAAAGLTGQLGESSWRVLSPGPIERSGSDSNAASITMLIESSNFRLLALADVPASVQDRISYQHSASLANRQVAPTILKVSHHGAADQSDNLIRLLVPQFAIFSAGRGNGYGHPTATALDMVESVGASIIRTDLDGGVALFLSDGELRID